MTEESCCPWHTPLVLVPKPDGSVRVCIEFRELNAISTFDAYPMPQIETLLYQVDQAYYLFTWDLAKGYWQIPLREVDKEKWPSDSLWVVLVHQDAIWLAWDGCHLPSNIKHR